MTKIVVKEAFFLALDDGKRLPFGPGETVPAEHNGHWYINQMVAMGKAEEQEGKAEKSDKDDAAADKKADDKPAGRQMGRG